MPSLEIRLLGGFHLLYNGQPVLGVGQRVQSLLAWLALHRDAPQPRRRLAFQLWPDSSEAQAHANLRKAIYDLQHTLPEIGRFLQIERHSLHWRQDAPFTLDVAQFDALLAQARRAENAQSALAKAVELYQGDLLPTCYEEWILPLREALRQRYLQALDQLVHLCKGQGQFSAAIAYAQQLLQADPLQESTYCTLMRLHLSIGDRALALRTYHICATSLQKELGVSPGSGTQALYQQLLQNERAPAPQVSPAPVRRATFSLIGRQEEWMALQAAWRAATSGRPQFVLVSGEAGIGKSRLAEEMLAWVWQQGGETAHTRSYAAGVGLAYAPVVEWLRTPALQQALAGLADVWQTELAHLLPELRARRPDLPYPEPLASPGHERWQRQRLFEALVRTVLAQTSPLLLVIDDLQWCDPETLDWLRYLLPHAHDLSARALRQQARLLVIATARLDEINQDHPLAALRFDLLRSGLLTELALGPLGADETAQLADQVSGQTPAREAASCLYHATEGNPLFIVEMARALAFEPIAVPKDEDTAGYTQTATAAEWQLPTRVQAVIQARLVQLSPAGRELAALAAVVGRFFTFEILIRASDYEEDTLVQGLDELWRRRIVREQGVNAYDFSHDRIREVAYSQISPARRRLLHRRIAQALAEIHANDLDPVSGQLAYHYEQAGLLEQAIFYYQRAVKMAQRLGADQDIIRHTTKALALLKLLPTSIDRTREQGALLLALANATGNIKGHTTPEMEQTLLQARVIAQEVADESLLFLAQQWLWAVLAYRGEWLAAHHMASHNLEVAQSSHNPVHLRTAIFMAGASRFHLGQFTQAYESYQHVMGVEVPPQAEAEDDSGTPLTTLCRKAQVLWMLGFADQAGHLMDQALALARSAYGRFSIGWVLRYAALLCQFRRDVAGTYRYAQEMANLDESYGCPECATWSALLLGWALAGQGEPAQGLTLLRQNFTPPSEGVLDILTYHLALLAEISGKVGQVSEGLEAIREALAVAGRTGCLFWNAELHRLCGQLLLANGAPGDQVEASFLQAVELAREQGAQSLQLRAATSLARLWRQQGRQVDARQLLAKIYEEFGEGFETPDLTEARHLLEQLFKPDSHPHSPTPRL